MSIKKCRERAELRQEDVANAMQTDRSTISKWETGEAMPRADKLPDLAKLLNCSIDDLFKEE